MRISKARCTTMNPSTHALGYQRDQKVLADLELFGCLSQEQIHLLRFWNVSTEMSHRCTQRLEKDKLIRRVKMKWAGEPDWFYPYDNKRPDQYQHRLGKAWIYTAWNFKILASAGSQQLIHFKTEEKRFYRENEKFPIPDDYAVIEHRVLGNTFHFGEFQVTESGNQWDKNYKALFDSFSPNDQLFLTIVATESYQSIREKLVKDLSRFKNVRVDFFTLDKLKTYCWRVALQLREKYRQKELITR